MTFKDLKPGMEVFIKEDLKVVKFFKFILNFKKSPLL